MGYLAFGHPFLDGNGRAIMTVHSVMAQRAGIGVNWSATSKIAYLSALSAELENPGKGILDNYLKPFIGNPIVYEGLAKQVLSAPGLDGSTTTQMDEVLGKSSEPEVEAEYEAMLRKREQE